MEITCEDPSALSDGDLETQLCALAGHLAAATCRWLLLLAELDKRDGWAGIGLRTLPQWLAWRCGLSPGTAREHVRVARALSGLPLLRTVFAEGRVSYSKVRAVTRVATQQTEQALVELALAGTAAQVERIVCGVREAADPDLEARRHARRRVILRWAEDGAAAGWFRLDPEEGATVLAALEAVRDSLTDRGEQAAVGDGPPPPPPTLADALVALCEQALAGPGLPEGPSGSRPDVVITAAAEALAADPPAPGGAAADLADPAPADPPAEPAGPAPADPPAAGEPARVVAGPALPAETARRVCCDAPLLRATLGPGGSALDLGRRSRRPSRALLRALWLRDEGCRFPGCGRTRWLHAHHRRHWARGGRTDLANLVLLCGTHHRLLHEGGFSIGDGNGGGGLRFARPDGTRVEQSPATIGDPLAALAAHAADINAETLLPHWRGEPLNLPDAVSAALAA